MRLIGHELTCPPGIFRNNFDPGDSLSCDLGDVPCFNILSVIALLLHLFPGPPSALLVPPCHSAAHLGKFHPKQDKGSLVRDSGHKSLIITAVARRRTPKLCNLPARLPDQPVPRNRSLEFLVEVMSLVGSYAPSCREDGDGRGLGRVEQKGGCFSQSRGWKGRTSERGAP